MAPHTGDNKPSTVGFFAENYSQHDADSGTTGQDPQFKRRVLQHTRKLMKAGIQCYIKLESCANTLDAKRRSNRILQVVRPSSGGFTVLSAVVGIVGIYYKYRSASLSWSIGIPSILVAAAAVSYWYYKCVHKPQLTDKLPPALPELVYIRQEMERIVQNELSRVGCALQELIDFVRANRQRIVDALCDTLGLEEASCTTSTLNEALRSLHHVRGAHSATSSPLWDVRELGVHAGILADMLCVVNVAAGGGVCDAADDGALEWYSRLPCGALARANVIGNLVFLGRALMEDVRRCYTHDLCKNPGDESVMSGASERLRELAAGVKAYVEWVESLVVFLEGDGMDAPTDINSGQALVDAVIQRKYALTEQ